MKGHTRSQKDKRHKKKKEKLERKRRIGILSLSRPSLPTPSATHLIALFLSFSLSCCLFKNGFFPITQLLSCCCCYYNNGKMNEKRICFVYQLISKFIFFPHPFESSKKKLDSFKPFRTVLSYQIHIFGISFFFYSFVPFIIVIISIGYFVLAGRIESLKQICCHWNEIGVGWASFTEWWSLWCYSWMEKWKTFFLYVSVVSLGIFSNICILQLMDGYIYRQTIPPYSILSRFNIYSFFMGFLFFTFLFWNVSLCVLC